MRNCSVAQVFLKLFFRRDDVLKTFPPPVIDSYNTTGKKSEYTPYGS
jgi:hypothetical protein